MRCRNRNLPRALLTSVLLASLASAQRATRQELGRSVPLRILVDKVMQPVARWQTEEWMIRETAEHGFNVFSPRRGYDDLEAVRRVTEWCRKYGIYHLVWMRGTLNAPQGPEADGKRVVWASGNEQLLWSVHSDEFWEWTTDYVLAYARISAEDPTLLGVFLDYENYAKGKEGNLYSLSYEDLILEAFAADRDLELPELPLAKRAGWLKEQKLHDAFETFQVAHWRQRCRRLREQVDALDPAFQFCIYPAPGTPFMVRGIYPEWATEQAPLMLADASTYGRSSRFIPQRAALDTNRNRLMTRGQVPAEVGIPHIYMGGIDPVVTGADPEFCGRNALMCATETDGYWVFYEGPAYRDDHPEYFKWFAWANQAIRDGRKTAWKEPRQSPEAWSLGIHPTDGDGQELQVPPFTGQYTEFPDPVTFRRGNLFLVSCRAGDPVHIDIAHVQVGSYVAPVTWTMRGPDWVEIGDGTIEPGKRDRLTLTPAADGVHLLALTAGACAYRITAANAPLGVLSEGGINTIYGASNLYLATPPTNADFSVRVAGYGAETVKAALVKPDATLAGTVQTTLEEPRATLKLDDWTPGQIWSVRLSKADEGVLEDARLWLGKGMIPVLSLSPEHVFR